MIDKIKQIFDSTFNRKIIEDNDINQIYEQNIIQIDENGKAILSDIDTIIAQKIKQVDFSKYRYNKGAGDYNNFITLVYRILKNKTQL